MFKNPLVIGVDSKALAHRRLSITERLSALGNNTGNMLFAESLFSVIRNAKRSDFHFTPDVADGCDCVVVAAANWINPYSDFEDLTRRLEKTRLPVIASGLGAQADLGGKVPSLKQGTERLLRLIADTSASISVRGDFTAQVLTDLGIRNISVTGCPSLLMAGEVGPKVRRPEAVNSNNTTLHSTRHLFNSASPFQLFLYREAFRQSLDLLLQSELADMQHLDSIGSPSTSVNTDLLQRVYHQNSSGDVCKYIELRAKVFWDLPSWINYAASRSFFIGTRIHGTIASLLAGTAATLVAHDERTKEMAQAMSIPFIMADAIDLSKPLELSELYSSADLDSFEKNYPIYLETFKRFFSINGLQLAMNSN